MACYEEKSYYVTTDASLVPTIIVQELAVYKHKLPHTNFHPNSTSTGDLDYHATVKNSLIQISSEAVSEQY